MQPFNLDTGGSDTKDKLAALRTKTLLERGSSPETEDEFVEVAEGSTAAASLRQSLDSPQERTPDGYVPRTAAGPSFMDRKLQHLQVESFQRNESMNPSEF